MNSIYHYQEETRINKHGQVWEETEHYCLIYGELKLEKIMHDIHLISFNVKIQLQCAHYGFQSIQNIK